VFKKGWEEKQTREAFLSFVMAVFSSLVLKAKEEGQDGNVLEYVNSEISSYGPEIFEDLTAIMNALRVDQ